MHSGRLIPDTQLQFSAELAASIGLEQAVLVQQLRSIYQHQPATQRDGLLWLHISRAYLLQLLPFWSDTQLLNYCQSLEDMGLVRLDHAHAAADSLLIALNDGKAPALSPKAPPVAHQDMSPPATVAATRQSETSTAKEVSTVGNTPAPPARANPDQKAPVPRRGQGEPLPRDFQPSEDMLELLEQYHGVPRAFALEQLEDFTLYWRERGSAAHAWQNKFKQHVQFQWARNQQSLTGANHGGEPGTSAARRTRDSSLEQDLTDTSWAD